MQTVVYTLLLALAVAVLLRCVALLDAKYGGMPSLNFAFSILDSYSRTVRLGTGSELWFAIWDRGGDKEVFAVYLGDRLRLGFTVYTWGIRFYLACFQAVIFYPINWRKA